MLGKTGYRRTFCALCITDFLLWLEWGISTQMLSIYVHELGGSPVEVGLVFSVFAGVNVFADLIWGAVSDYLGRRKILIVLGMTGIVPIFLLMSMQKNILYLILLRGCTAIFKGAVVPTTWALVSDVSPSEKVGSNMGVLSSFELSGFALGSVVGGFIADTYGFPTLWIFVAAECLVGALVFLFGGFRSDNNKAWRKEAFL